MEELNTQHEIRCDDFSDLIEGAQCYLSSQSLKDHSKVVFHFSYTIDGLEGVIGQARREFSYGKFKAVRPEAIRDMMMAFFSSIADRNNASIQVKMRDIKVNDDKAKMTFVQKPPHHLYRKDIPGHDHQAYLQARSIIDEARKILAEIDEML